MTKNFKEEQEKSLYISEGRLQIHGIASYSPWSRGMPESKELVTSGAGAERWRVIYDIRKVMERGETGRCQRLKGLDVFLWMWRFARFATVTHHVLNDLNNVGFLTLLEDGHPISRYQQGWFLVRTLFLPSCCVITVSPQCNVLLCLFPEELQCLFHWSGQQSGQIIAPPLGPHVTLPLYLQVQLHWGLGLQHMNFVGIHFSDLSSIHPPNSTPSHMWIHASDHNYPNVWTHFRISSKSEVSSKYYLNYRWNFWYSSSLNVIPL